MNSSIGDIIFRSVRLFCVTIFLIGLMQIMPTLSQLWVYYDTVKKVEKETQPNPAAAGPAFRAAPPELRPPSQSYGAAREEKL